MNICIIQKNRKYFLSFVSLLLSIMLSSSSLVWALAEEEELFFVAQNAFDDGFYDVATRYLTQFLNEYPQSEKNIKAKLLLGQSYFFDGKYLKAFDNFQQLLGYSDSRDATLFWLGETYLKGSDYSQAEKHYRQLIEIYPNSSYTPQAYYSLAWTFWEQKKCDLARDTFSQLIQLFPTHKFTEDAFFKIGECEYNLTLYESAIKYFQDYILRFENSTRFDQAYFYIAEAYYYLGDFIKANTYYAKVENLSEDNKLILMAKVGTGWTYLKLRNFNQAQESFIEAERFSEEKSMPLDDIYLGQASLFAEMGENEKALKAYETLISTFPNSARIAEAYLGKGNILYIIENYSDAITTYKELIEKFSLEPNLQQVVEKSYFGLAWTYLKSGRIDLSIKSFEKIINRTKSKVVKVSALTQIGDAYQENGDLKKALEIYDRILKDFSDSLYTDYVQYQQALVFLKMNKIEAATFSLQTLQANFPNSKYLNDSNYYLALAYFKKGDWAAAKEQIELFLKKDHKTNDFLAEANYILASSLLNLEKAEKAVAVFQRVIKSYPQYSAIIKNSELGIAQCLYEMGKIKEAIKRFKILVYKYSKTETAQESLLWLGDHYLGISDFKNALKYYQELVVQLPNSTKINSVRYQLGQIYQEQGDLDQALNQYMLISDPADQQLFAKAKLAIADIFSKDLDPDAAVETYTKIATNCPGFKRDAYLRIGEVYTSHNKFKKAIDFYQKAIEEDEGLSDVTKAELQFLIGETYETLNQPDESIEAYLKIPYLYPEDTLWVVKAYLRAARIFENREEWENAQITYHKIIKHDTDELKFAQERLEWINENIFEANP